MKTLIVVRHAKTKQALAGEADFDRKLTERGKTDAPDMATKLKAAGFTPQAFVSSTAKRTMQTAKLFCEVFEADKKKIHEMAELYHAPQHIYYNVVNMFKDKWDTVAVFGHNGGVTDFVNSLCAAGSIDHMPTGSVFVVQADIEHWADFKKGENTYKLFLSPKMG